MEMEKSTEFQRTIMEGNLRNNIATPNDIRNNWNAYIWSNKQRTYHNELQVNIPKVSGAWVRAYTYKNDNDIDVVSIDINNGICCYNICNSKYSTCVYI